MYPNLFRFSKSAEIEADCDGIYSLILPHPLVKNPGTRPCILLLIIDKPNELKAHGPRLIHVSKINQGTNEKQAFLGRIYKTIDIFTA